jgi:hypothetical protein
MANSSSTKPQVEPVSAKRLSELFDRGQYRERYSRGELKRKLYHEELAPLSAGQPANTLSQLFEYLDDGLKRVALIHQYRLPDGTLGASGREDPKQIVDDGIIYILKSGE